MVSQKWSIGLISLALFVITATSAEFLIQQVTEGRGTEKNSSYSLTSNLGVTRVLRDERPSSKIMTITSFSKIKDRQEFYVSSAFEAAGYKWRLVLFVNGKPEDGGNNHISLYVAIQDTKSLPKGWEVNVDLKLFVHNGKQHKYLTVTDETVKRFNDANKELGYGQLISRTTFLDPNQGYLEQDTASFGAEIFLVEPAKLQEKVTFISNPRNNVFTWKILRFSTLEDKFYYSDEFLVEDRYWKMRFNPYSKGDGKGPALVVFFTAAGFKQSAVDTNTWVVVNLKLKNQRSSNHKQTQLASWFPFWAGNGVVNNMISLSELKDTSKGYLVNDSIILEAELVETSVTNIVSA